MLQGRKSPTINYPPSFTPLSLKAHLTATGVDVLLDRVSVVLHLRLTLTNITVDFSVLNFNSPVTA